MVRKRENLASSWEYRTIPLYLLRQTPPPQCFGPSRTDRLLGFRSRRLAHLPTLTWRFDAQTDEGGKPKPKPNVVRGRPFTSFDEELTISEDAFPSEFCGTSCRTISAPSLEKNIAAGKPSLAYHRQDEQRGDRAHMSVFT